MAMVDDDPDVLAIIDSYPALRKAIAARRKEIGLSQLEADDIAGTQSGYQGKIECGAKHFGEVSLPSILGALGLKLAVIRVTPHAERQRLLRRAAA